MAHALMIKDHEAILLRNICEFADNLKNLSKVLDMMIAKEVIYRNEKNEILLKGTPYDQNSEFVRTLITKEDKAFNVFVNILNDTNQKGLAALLAPGQTDGNYEDSGSAPRAVTVAASSSTQVPGNEKDILRKHQRQLCLKMTSITEIVDGLHGEKVISDTDREAIKGKETPYEKKSALMTYLMQKAPKGFHAFVQLLKETDQDDLAELLTQGEDNASTSRAGRTAVKRTGGSAEQPQSTKKAKAESLDSDSDYNSDEEFEVSDSPSDVDVVKCTKQFFKEHSKKKKDVYAMSKPQRGKALIINLKYRGKQRRKGTDVDRDNLKQLFKQLGLEVTVYNDKDDLTAEGIRKKVKEFASEENHKDSQCCVLVLLCHGGNGYIVGTDANPLKVDKLQSYLNRCPTLTGKPKLTLLQACRGKNVDDGVDHPPSSEEGDESDESDESEDESSSDKPDDLMAQHGDALIGYPTPEDYKAWRNKKTGSWYISAVVKVFETHPHHKHASELLTRVNRIVRRQVTKNSKEPEKANKTQMPVYQSSQSRDWYFFPGIPQE